MLVLNELQVQADLHNLDGDTPIYLRVTVGGKEYQVMDKELYYSVSVERQLIEGEEVDVILLHLEKGEQNEI